MSAHVDRRTLSFAHEVANPLGGMFVQAQLLRRDATTSGCSPEVVDRIGVLLGEIERLNRLLADFRRSASREAPAPPRPLDVSSMLEHALRFSVVDPRIDVQRCVPDSLPILGYGGDRLQQVFVNLIKNAVEAMPSGGTLEVRARSDARSIHVEIGDTGCGLPVGIGTKPGGMGKAGGRGLGLGIASQIVSELGGTLSFTSAQGVGTTFTVTVPIAGPGRRGRGPSSWAA